jgi:hypothetical protein
MPKIVRFHEVGGPEVLKIEERESICALTMWVTMQPSPGTICYLR